MQSEKPVTLNLCLKTLWNIKTYSETLSPCWCEQLLASVPKVFPDKSVSKEVVTRETVPLMWTKVLALTRKTEKDVSQVKSKLSNVYAESTSTSLNMRNAFYKCKKHKRHFKVSPWYLSSICIIFKMCSV